MKKILTFVSLSVIVLSSCGKDYNCSCKDPERIFEYKNLKKSEAREACQLQDKVWSGPCSLE